MTPEDVLDFVTKICVKQGAAEPEDVAMDVMVKLLRRPCTNPVTERSYIYRVAVNCCHDAARRQKRRAALEAKYRELKTS